MSFLDGFNRFMQSYPKEKSKGLSAGAVIFLILFVIIGGVLSNYRNDPDVFFAAFLYMIMMAIAAMIGAFDFSSRLTRKSLQAYIFFPKDAKSGFIKLAIGGIIGWAMITQSYSIGIPMQLAGLNSFLFVVITAPIAEEAFFRAALIPSLANSFRNSGLIKKWNWVAAIIFGNIMFAYWHGYVYGFNSAAMYAAFLIGILYTFIMIFFKDSNVNIGAHMMNNYLLWAMAGGMLG